MKGARLLSRPNTLAAVTARNDVHVGTGIDFRRPLPQCHAGPWITAAEHVPGRTCRQRHTLCRHVRPLVAAQSVEIAGRRDITQGAGWKGRRRRASALPAWSHHDLYGPRCHCFLADRAWRPLAVAEPVAVSVAVGCRGHLPGSRPHARLGAPPAAALAFALVQRLTLAASSPKDGPHNLTRTLFQHPVGPYGYLLGILLGFLPCGLLYGALIVAAATARPVTAALAMLAFALGTFPLSWARSKAAALRFGSATRPVCHWRY